MILPRDFKEFLQLLNSHRVEYLMIGGYAVGFYGYPRATADMDVWVNANSENAKKLVEVLKEFGFGEVEADVFQKEKQIIRMGTPPLRIELLTSISGVRFGECYGRRSNAEVDGVEVSLIGLEDLKMNKAASGRYKDMDDLEHLP